MLTAASSSSLSASRMAILASMVVPMRRYACTYAAAPSTTGGFLRSSRRCLDSARFTGDPSVTPETAATRIKKELIKALKIQLVLLPICAVFLFVWFPIESPEERKKLIEQYEKHSGWKT